jgi:hypothetical protein
MGGEQHVSRPTIKKLRELGRAAGLEEVRLGRAFGVAPFLSVFGWRFATAVDRFEDRLGSPLGLLIYGLWRKP